MLSKLVCDLSKLNLLDNSNGLELILSNIRGKFPTLFPLNNSISYNNSSLFNLFIFLIQGWISLFSVFVYLGVDLGKYLVKLSLIKLMLFKSNLIVADYLV